MSDLYLGQLIHKYLFEGIEDYQLGNICPNELDKLDGSRGDAEFGEEASHLADFPSTKPSEVKDTP
jgi:hypothetical protein